MLLVTPNQSYHATEWANAGVLGVPLQVGAKTLGKHLDGSLIVELHLELGSSGTNLSNHNTRVVLVAHDHCTDAVTDIVNVGDAVGHNQLVRHLLLCAHDNTVVAADGHRCLPVRLDGLEGILDLIDATIRGEHFDQLVLQRHYVFFSSKTLILIAAPTFDSLTRYHRSQIDDKI